MAHLNPLADGGRDRAQLIIVSAFALGVLFVALALILNSAIFTENLASRGETTGGEDVVTYEDALERGVGDVLTYENTNVTTTTVSHGTLETRVTTATRDINSVLVRRNARTGATSTATVDSKLDGTLIRQNATANFTNNESDADWELVSSVDRTRAFTMNVTGANSSCTRFTSCFTLIVDNGADWELSINNTTGGFVVAVDNGSGTATCGPVNEPSVTVDVTGGTFGGRPCPAMNFSEAPDSGYEIEYENADEITGTYSLVVDDAGLSSPPLPDDYASTITEDPFATPALYSVNVTFDYQTADVNYNSTVRVAPGEPDA
ncbi:MULTISPECIES: hypothetical protein [Salinibaculum]|uniref:hypothetical protein n=1 Tax=Salinibaculum TaxID=2732368 RepID=UPI0030D2AEC6